MTHPDRTTETTRARARRIACLAAAACVAFSTAAGCYQRTVSSSGLGSRNVDTHQPNIRTGEDRSALDKTVDAIIGPPREDELR